MYWNWILLFKRLEASSTSFSNSFCSHSKFVCVYLSKRIALCVENICNAGNKEEFAPIILEELSNISSEELIFPFAIIL